MDVMNLPRFRLRATPPIGRAAPGNSVAQCTRALAILSVAMLTAFVVVHRPESRADTSVHVAMAQQNGR